MTVKCTLFNCLHTVFYYITRKNEQIVIIIMNILNKCKKKTTRESFMHFLNNRSNTKNDFCNCIKLYMITLKIIKIDKLFTIDTREC